MSNIDILYELLIKFNNNYCYSKTNTCNRERHIRIDQIISIQSIKLLNVKYAYEYNKIINKKMISVKFNLKDDLGVWCLNIDYDKYKDVFMKFII